MNTLASINWGTTKIPTPQLAGNALAITVCLIITGVLWHWGSKFDHKITLILAIFVGLILATTSLGPHLLTWVGRLTNGYLA